MTNAKTKYHRSHFVKVPLVNFDETDETTRLKEHEFAMGRAMLNVNLAMEMLSLHWRMWEDYKRQLAPHGFVPDSEPVSASARATRPQRCRVCWRGRVDARHGALPSHTFRKCGRSSLDQCFLCGLPRLAKPHQLAEYTRTRRNARAK
jgi:hypothetical protein